MKLYELFLTEACWTPQEQNLMQYLSPQRREQVNRYRFAEDRLLSLYGGLLVRMGVCEAVGIVPAQQKFLHVPLQKPRLCNDGVSLEFNLSHTKNAVICGFSEQPIGVDAEWMENPYPEEVLSFFRPEEQALCRTGGAEAFYQLWTRKEAFSKWNGLGLSMELSEIDTTLQGYQTWHRDRYMISVYANPPEQAEILEITVKTVQDFYRQFRPL